MSFFRRLFGGNDSTNNKVPSTDYSTAKYNFLKHNCSFSTNIAVNLFTKLEASHPWLLHPENATAQTLRTVFIGSDDLYVFVGTPYFGSGPIENRYPWPQTFNVMNGGRTVIHYTHLRISYPNDLGHAPISAYPCSVSNVTVPKEQVLSWVAEDICENFKRKYPQFNSSDTTLTQSKDYYYFTYNVVKPQLAGW